MRVVVEECVEGQKLKRKNIKSTRTKSLRHKTYVLKLYTECQEGVDGWFGTRVGSLAVANLLTEK